MTNPNVSHRYCTHARGVGHRLTVSAVSLCVFCIAWFENGSLLHETLNRTGSFAWPFVAFMALLAVVAVIDVVVNDMMSDRYNLPVTLEGRMYGYMLQAAMNASIVVTIWETGYWSWVASVYVVLACSSVWIAVFDTYHRYVVPHKLAKR